MTETQNAPGAGSHRAMVFGAVADDYARLRPAPCPAAIDWLVPDGCRRVLDLAAGAGTLAVRLAERVPEVVAVEPDARMRTVLTSRAPQVTALEGTAESIPLPDADVDAIVVSSAWHWFDPPRAVPEIARVLRPGGRLGVVWNGVDTRVPWIAEWQGEFRRMRDAGTLADGGPDHTRRYRRRGEVLKRDLESGAGLFADLEETTVTCVRTTTPAGAAELLGTYSQVILMEDADRAALLAAAEASLCTMLGVGAEDEIELPFRSLCWRTVRTPAA